MPQLEDDFEAELIESFTIDEVERRLEMTFYCCKGGDGGPCCYIQ